jgi:Tol biopolymer transport system component
MAAPANETQTRDELFWLFPILLIVAIVAITVVVRPSGCSFGPGKGGKLPEGAPPGQVSGTQAESSVVLPKSDESGVRTLDQLAALLEDPLYQQDTSQTPADNTGTFVDATTPGPGLKIVIRSDIEEESNSDIYMLDETGYNPKRLTTWASVESFPAITTDHSRAYFVSDNDDDPNNPNPFTKNTEIYMIDLAKFEQDGKADPTRLTFNNETDYGVSVSADGSKMVFASATKEVDPKTGEGGPDNPVLILADGDGNNAKVIANKSLKNAIPKISGDGNYVVYNSFLDGEMDIYLYDVKGGFTVNLTNSDIPEYFPAINFDGSVIVYEKLLGGSPQAEDYIELFACDKDGKNERQLTKNRFADTFPAVTDDGKWIVFVSKRWDFDGDKHYDEALFYMDSKGEANGATVYKITKDPFFEEQPDV